MEKITINDIVENRNSKEKIIGTSFIIRLIGGIVLILISQITLYILTDGDTVSQILGIIMGICMLFKAFEVIEYYLQSQMNLKITSIIRFITSIVVTITKILVVYFDFGVIGFICTYFIDAAVAGILFFIWYKKNNKEKWKPSKEYAKSLLSRCWYVAIGGLLVTIYMRIDQVMLGSMLENKTQNGIYSAAVRIAEMWYFVPTAVITAIQPIILKSKTNGNEDEYNKNMQRLYDIVSIISITCGIIISLFGGLVVDILYGVEYKGAYEVLSISVWAGLFALLGTARSIWLVAEEKQKYTLVFTIMGGATNIILNSIFIPKMGAIGAAIATLIAQFVANVIALMPIKATRKSSIMILKSIFCNKTVVDLIICLRKKIDTKTNAE